MWEQRVPKLHSHKTWLWTFVSVKKDNSISLREQSVCKTRDYWFDQKQDHLHSLLRCSSLVDVWKPIPKKPMLQSCRKAGPYQTQHSAATSTFILSASIRSLRHNIKADSTFQVFIPGKLSNSVFFYSFMIAFIYFTHVLHFLISFICTVPLCVSITAKAQLKLFSCTFECPSFHSFYWNIKLYKHLEEKLW